MLTVREELERRRLQPERYTSVYVDEEERIARFLMWNLSGQLVGFQSYRPDADKTKKNDSTRGRYFTYFTPSEKGHRMIGVWGLETLRYDPRVLFLCEGIFKAVPFHNEGLPAIATMSNNPKHLRSQLFLIASSGRKLIVVGDNDEGGSSTKSMSYPVILPPAHVKDVDDLPVDEFKQWVDKFRHLWINS